MAALFLCLIILPSVLLRENPLPPPLVEEPGLLGLWRPHGINFKGYGARARQAIKFRHGLHPGFNDLAVYLKGIAPVKNN